MAESERNLGRDMAALMVYLAFSKCPQSHKDTLIAAGKRIATLEASLAAAERNGRRYLWLKGHWVGRDQIFSQQIWNAGWNELDAAIDALATKERKDG